MAYETKVILFAIAKIVNKADSIQEIYEALSDMATTESIKLPPFTGKKDV